MGCGGGAIGDNGQNLVKNDFFAFETNEDNPNLDNHINIKKSLILREPYIFFGKPFYSNFSYRPPWPYYHRNVIFKTFPGKEVKIFRLFQNNPDDRQVIEFIGNEINNEDFNNVLQRLKTDIEKHRHSIQNDTFCSTIYNYIEGLLSKNS